MTVQPKTLLWLDAQISSHLAVWLSNNFPITAYSLEFLGLDEADDLVVFQQAKQANAIVMSKDEDFVALHYRLGAPPKIIWLTCGNTSNAALRILLLQTLPDALQHLRTDDIVEIQDIF